MRNIFRTVFYLRSNYVNKDGNCTILQRIYLNGERLTVGATGISISPTMWDSKKEKIKGRTAESMQLNQQLENLRSKIMQIFTALENDPDISLERIKSEFVGESKELTYLSSLFDKVNGDIKSKVDAKAVSYSTYRRYEVTKRLVFEFLAYKYRRKDMRLNEVTSLVIHDFELYLRTFVGYKNNTAVKMMKQFKTVILFAQKSGLIKHDPFINLHLSKRPTDRAFLTEEEIMKIATHEITLPRLDVVRDIFIFSCFTGLAYIDVASLTEDNIVTMNGKEWIMTRRQKTEVASNILLLEIPKHIINKYSEKRAKGGRLLPILSNQKTNAYLKEIGEICGIQKTLSFHLARHSFATMTLSKGVPIESVSKMLGHTSIRTTQIYARITNKKIEHDMEEFASQIGDYNASFKNKDKVINTTLAET